MRRVISMVLVAALLLLAASVWAADGFGRRSDGWYAPPKDPVAVLDYAIDWSAWLGTDTISTSVWTATSGITKGLEGITGGNQTVYLWLSGGTAGQAYTLTNTITTAGGRTQKQTFKLEVRSR